MSDRLKLFLPLIFVALIGIPFIIVLRDKGYDPQSLPSALIDKPVPEFSLPRLGSNEQATPSSLKGEPALINVWATWCPSCRAEYPYLVKLAQQGVAIYGLDYKDDSDEAQKWIAELGDPYRFNIVDREGTLGLDLGVYGAPETYLIDSAGIIRAKHVGVVDERVWQETLQPVYLQLKGGTSPSKDQTAKEPK
jgi:cytochrome c biogenesis protein CcmG/thiol:disulfide interchange protein DsbE